MKYYRYPWTKEKLDILLKWWPHFGSEILSETLQLTIQQIKSKVNKLKIKILPKKERLCANCKEKYQSSRAYGVLCRDCSLSRRKKLRTNTEKPRDLWMRDLLRTLRYRSIETCDLTVEYLLDLWNKQNGKCIYTNFDLREPIFYGRGRNYRAASLDRVDSNRGYIQGNVVWCCWGCNVAKSDFSLDDFINFCSIIYKNSHSIKEKLSKYSTYISP